MAFGNELQDFVSAFQVGYSMFKSKDEREEEREKRQRERDLHRMKLEDHEYKRQRDTIDDAYRREALDFRIDESGRQQGRWEIDQAWREEERRRQRQLRELETETLYPDTGDVRTRNPLDVDDTTTNSIPQSHSRSRDPSGGPQIAYAMVNDLQRDFGLSRGAAIGVVGQLAAESGGFSQLQELNPVVPGSRGGAGYAQWTGPRRRQFESYAQANKLDPSTYSGNYSFLSHELKNTPEGRILASLKNVDDPIQAGRIFTGSERERKGFLRPRIVNQRGRDNWTRKVASLFDDEDQVVAGYARGGLVTALDDEDEMLRPSGAIPLPDERQQAAEVQVAQASPRTPPQQMALPEEPPVPTPRYEGVQDDTRQAIPEENSGGYSGNTDMNDRWNVARLSVRKGLEKAIANLGLDDPSAIDDPDLERRRIALIRGYGATTQGIMRQVLDKIDPDREMPEAQRNYMALAEVYKYYNERGEFEAAENAAASMMQYYRRTFQQFAAIAIAAQQEGDLDTATAAAISAYANIPDGRDLQVKELGNGRYEVSVMDLESGDRISKQVMDPEQFVSLAMSFTPGDFEGQIMRAAGAQPVEVNKASRTDLDKINEQMDLMFSDAVEGGDEANLPFLQSVPPSLRTEFRHIAGSIAGNIDNQVGVEKALDITHRLLQLDDLDTSNRNPPFTFKPMPGGKAIEITLPLGGGATEKIVVSPNVLNSIMATHRKLFENREQYLSEMSEKGFFGKAADLIGNIAGEAKKFNQQRIGEEREFGITPPEQPPAPPRKPDVDSEEFANIQDRIQQMRYQGVPLDDPELQALMRRLEELRDQGAETQAIPDGP